MDSKVRTRAELGRSTIRLNIPVHRFFVRCSDPLFSHAAGAQVVQMPLRRTWLFLSSSVLNRICKGALLAHQYSTTASEAKIDTQRQTSGTYGKASGRLPAYIYLCLSPLCPALHAMQPTVEEQLLANAAPAHAARWRRLVPDQLRSATHRRIHQILQNVMALDLVLTPPLWDALAGSSSVSQLRMRYRMVAQKHACGEVCGGSAHHTAANSPCSSVIAPKVDTLLRFLQVHAAASSCPAPSNASLPHACVPLSGCGSLAPCTPPLCIRCFQSWDACARANRRGTDTKSTNYSTQTVFTFTNSRMPCAPSSRP